MAPVVPPTISPAGGCSEGYFPQLSQNAGSGQARPNTDSRTNSHRHDPCRSSSHARPGAAGV